MAKCRVCSEEKEPSEFYPQQLRKAGDIGECMECTKTRVRDNRARRVEYYREYDAERFQKDPRVRERHRRYKKTDKGGAVLRESRLRWVGKNPEKRAAHIAVGNAVRSGKLTKPSTCSKCGESAAKIHGHHNDYSKPLEVVWLCPSCHAEVHRRKAIKKDETV